MSTKPLTLKGVIDVDSEDHSEESRQLRRENQRLDEALRQVRNELGQAIAEKENLERSIRALRNQLGPLHHALRAVFGEIELAVGEEEFVPARASGAPAQSGGNAPPDRWNAIKQRLTKKQAELIDVLLLQGRMNRTQCAKAIKSDYTFCRKSVVAPLLSQGLLVECDDGLLELKQL
jgi:predicted nuclease with TOPRIM domain